MKRPKAKPAAKRLTKQPPPVTPEWTYETPGVVYHLLADDEIGGSWKQNVELTRSEFDALKRQLSVMRGHEVPEEATNA